MICNLNKKILLKCEAPSGFVIIVFCDFFFFSPPIKTWISATRFKVDLPKLLSHM